jgi:hypothetical protein
MTENNSIYNSMPSNNDERKEILEQITIIMQDI